MRSRDALHPRLCGAVTLPYRAALLSAIAQHRATSRPYRGLLGAATTLHTLILTRTNSTPASPIAVPAANPQWAPIRRDAL